eukprot:Em0710g1a
MNYMLITWTTPTISNSNGTPGPLPLPYLQWATWTPPTTPTSNGPPGPFHYPYLQWTTWTPPTTPTSNGPPGPLPLPPMDHLDPSHYLQWTTWTPPSNGSRSDQLTTLLGDQDCASSRSSTNVAVLILSNFFQLFLLAITVLRIDYQLCFWSGRKDFYSCLPKMLLGDCV